MGRSRRRALGLAFVAPSAAHRLARDCLRFLDHPERIDLGSRVAKLVSRAFSRISAW